MLVRRILTEAGYRCQAVTDSRAAAKLRKRSGILVRNRPQNVAASKKC